MIRIFRGETGLLAGLRDDLLVWLCTYDARPGSTVADHAEWGARGDGRWPGRARGASGLRRAPLPRGRGALPPDVVAGEHRERILAAVARLSWRRGLRAMTVADIVAAAGSRREAFYEQFRSKEDAFLAALELALRDQRLAQAAGEFFSGDDLAGPGLERAAGDCSATSRQPRLRWRSASSRATRPAPPRSAAPSRTAWPTRSSSRTATGSAPGRNACRASARRRSAARSSS